MDTPYFPPEIVRNVLSRLAVKPLLRFKCVSRSWYALIESPNFIKFHLNQSIITNFHRTLFLGGIYSIHSFNLDSFHNLIQLNHPLKSHEFRTEILGTVNGLLCLYNSPKKDIVLWNPSTQTHHKLPPIHFPDPIGVVGFLHAFGYDHLNEDYKVVMIKQFFTSDGILSSLVNVYSLKSNSWRIIWDSPFRSSYTQTYGVFANGALHWVVTPYDKLISIAAFDLGTEEFRSVPPPDCSDTDFNRIVGVLGGCLCVVSTSHLHYINVWVMKDYGVKESWTKLISLEQTNDIKSISLPVAYSKSGEQVLFMNGGDGFVWYDLKRKKIEIVTVGSLQHFLSSNVCVESLVKFPHDGGREKNLPSVEESKDDKKKNKQVPNKRLDLVSVRDYFLLKVLKVRDYFLLKVLKVSRWCCKNMEEIIDCIES